MLDVALPDGEGGQRRRRDGRRARAPGTLVQPWLGASMIAVTSDDEPDDRQDAADPVDSCGRRGSRDSGTRRRAATIAPTAIGTLTMNTDPHQKWSRRNPPASGPRTTPMPMTPDQMPIAMARSRASVNVLVRMLNVAGMMNAAAPPMTARAVTSWPTPPANAAAVEASGEHGEADGERASASPAVAERSGEQEQAGEDDGVGVDDPLQFADAGAELADERRERDVDDGVVDDDDQQAHAEHRQGEPATVVRRVDGVAGVIASHRRRGAVGSDGGRRGVSVRAALIAVPPR